MAFSFGLFLGAFVGVGLFTRLIKWLLRKKVPGMNGIIIAALATLLLYTVTNAGMSSNFYSTFLIYFIATIIWLLVDIIMLRKQKRKTTVEQ